MKSNFTRHMPTHMLGRGKTNRMTICLCHKRFGIVDGKCPRCGNSVDKYNYIKRPYS